MRKLWILFRTPDTPENDMLDLTLSHGGSPGMGLVQFWFWRG